MFWAQQCGYDKYYTTDASPRVFDVIEFFNRHAEVSLGAYKLAQSLNHQEILNMMQHEDFNGLMKMVNKAIYRV